MNDTEFGKIKLANKLKFWRPKEPTKLYEMTEDEYESGGNAIDGLYTILGELSEYKRKGLEELVDDVQISNVEEVERLVNSIIEEIKFNRIYTLIANIGLFAVGIICGLIVAKFMG